MLKLTIIGNLFHHLLWLTLQKVILEHKQCVNCSKMLRRGNKHCLPIYMGDRCAITIKLERKLEFWWCEKERYVASALSARVYCRCFVAVCRFSVRSNALRALYLHRLLLNEHTIAHRWRRCGVRCPSMPPPDASHYARPYRLCRSDDGRHRCRSGVVPSYGSSAIMHQDILSCDIVMRSKQLNIILLRSS